MGNLSLPHVFVLVRIAQYLAFKEMFCYFKKHAVLKSSYVPRFTKTMLFRDSYYLSIQMFGKSKPKALSYVSFMKNMYSCV